MRRKNRNPTVAGSQNIIAPLRVDVNARSANHLSRARRYKVILDKMRTVETVSVRENDIVARRDRERVVATAINAKTFVLLPDVDQRNRRPTPQRARNLERFLRRTVVGDDDLARRNRLLYRGLDCESKKVRSTS